MRATAVPCLTSFCPLDRNLELSVSASAEICCCPSSEAELSNASCCPPEIHMEVLMCALVPGPHQIQPRGPCVSGLFPTAGLPLSLLWEESLMVTPTSAFPHQFYDWDQACLLCATSTCIFLSNFPFCVGNLSLWLVQILFCWM